VANTDALAHSDPDCWPDQLTRHLVEPVRWRECQRTLAAMGVDTLVELGPGRVLAGLARRTLPEVRVLNIAKPTDVADAAGQLVPETVSSVAQGTTPVPPEDRS
jgi:[acyl-carrier-protein] S-malonyltransferase